MSPTTTKRELISIVSNNRNRHYDYSEDQNRQKHKDNNPRTLSGKTTINKKCLNKTNLDEKVR